MTRRTNSDSGRNQIARNAIRKGTIQPPPGMTGKELEVFNNLVKEFSLEEITSHKIELIAVVAKTLSMATEQQALLAAEGAVVVSPQGAKPNPRFNIIQNALATVVKMRRTLGLGNYTRTLRDVAIQRSHIKQQERDVISILDDPNIKKPGDGPAPAIKHQLKN